MRVQLFEFHDLPWYPHVWRQILTAHTGFFARAFDIFHPIVPRLAHALRQCGATAILDLCSGASGPLALLQEQLAVEERCVVTVMMSDKYPDIDAFQHAVRGSGDALAFVETPVDATAVPATLRGFRTLFNAFHHFDPVTARRILQDAATSRAGIGVFEYTERSLVWYVSALLSPLFFWVTGPFALRPISLTKLLWVYVLPIPTVLGVWDALVSCLRTYSTESLRAQIGAIVAPGYAWDVGRVRAFGGCYVTYLIGYPSSEQVGGVEAVANSTLDMAEPRAERRHDVLTLACPRERLQTSDRLLPARAPPRASAEGGGGGSNPVGRGERGRTGGALGGRRGPCRLRLAGEGAQRRTLSPGSARTWGQISSSWARTWRSAPSPAASFASTCASRTPRRARRSRRRRKREPRARSSAWWRAPGRA